ncbi:MAG: NAD-dependent epimerase/dehydratase family protein [Chloroflexota bacterium]
MSDNRLVAITGAYSYTGKYITRRLLARGQQVITLTGHPERPNEFGQQLKAFPFNFDHPDRLVESLRGVSVLYNTYWVRFDHGQNTFARAIENTRILFESARAAGVERIVHVSITNPSLDSPLPYFRGKAELEEILRATAPSYAIVRPTVIFGLEDILINNIAFMLRHFPIFAIPGTGKYRLQPIYVEDMAELCIQAGAAPENLLLDAVGPQVFTFNDLVQVIARQVGSRARVIHMPATLPLYLSRLIGMFVSDVVLTEDEIRGLSADLLVSANPATGKTRLEDWLSTNVGQIGKHYASELARHYR